MKDIKNNLRINKRLELKRLQNIKYFYGKLYTHSQMSVVTIQFIFLWVKIRVKLLQHWYKIKNCKIKEFKFSYEKHWNQIASRLLRYFQISIQGTVITVYYLFQGPFYIVYVDTCLTLPCLIVGHFKIFEVNIIKTNLPTIKQTKKLLTQKPREHHANTN